MCTFWDTKSPVKGRFYKASTSPACRFLETCSFTSVDLDLLIIKRGRKHRWSLVSSCLHFCKDCSSVTSITWSVWVWKTASVFWTAFQQIRKNSQCSQPKVFLKVKWVRFLRTFEKSLYSLISGMWMHSLQAWCSALTHSLISFYFQKKNVFVIKPGKQFPSLWAWAYWDCWSLCSSHSWFPEKSHTEDTNVYEVPLYFQMCVASREVPSFCFYLAVSLPWRRIFKWNDTMCLKLMHVSGSDFVKVGRRGLMPCILGYS